MASGISNAASRPEIAKAATASDRDDDAGDLEAAREPRRVGIDEQVDQQQEPAEDRDAAEKVEHRRRSLAQLRGQPQHLASLLLAVGGQRAIAAGRIDRDGAEQFLEAGGAGEVEGEIGAARQASRSA